MTNDIWEQVNALGGYLPPDASDYDRGYSAAVDAALEIIERSSYETLREENAALRQIIARVLDDGSVVRDAWMPSESALDLARDAIAGGAS